MFHMNEQKKYPHKNTKTTMCYVLDCTAVVFTVAYYMDIPNLGLHKAEITVVYT